MCLIVWLTACGIPCFASDALPAPADSHVPAPNHAEASDSVEDEDTFIRVTTLDDVVITEKNQKYSKKNNPAYELMKRIRNARKQTDPRLLPEYSEDYYTKITLGLNDCDASSFTGKDKYRFLEEYIDTAANTGVPVMLLSLREKAGTRYHSLNFLKDKDVVRGERAVGIDDQFDQANITVALNEYLRNIDIYSDDINLFQKRFVSPVSHLADNFYKYSLNDTVILNGVPHLELVFAPFNPQSDGFNGRLFVEANDSSYLIRRVEMRIPRYINLNFADNVYITQEYDMDIYGKRHLASDDISLELKAFPGSPALYVRRQTNVDSPKFSDARSLHNFLIEADRHIVFKDDDEQPWDKWEDMRMIPLSRAESGLGTMMNRLRRYPAVYWIEKILKTLVDGYITTGRNSMFDIGPINSFLSFSSIEGTRLRVGGLTTANLSDHWFARGYLAYGFGDRKFKYNAELEYSLAAKKYHSREFPVNSLRVFYSYDLDDIGQHYVYTNSDNIFLSLKRKASKLSLYRREAGLTYQLELKNNLSFLASFRHRIYSPSEWLPFVDGYGHRHDSYTLAGFMLEIRYAPGEKYFQRKTHRYLVNRDAPVLCLRQEIVPKGMLGSAFTLNKTELSLSKRFWFSAFGYADVILKGGKLWSKVEYPALLWQNANLSFTIQPESYSLMNPMEFPMDYFGSIDIGYNGNGILFNRIPLIKRLKLREVITFKGLMGGLTSKNDPDRNPAMFRIPSDVNPTRMTSTPYMELSAGIDNILSCLRFDAVWRLTYRHAPDIDRWGLRVAFHISF